jgi:hypothetical protein
VSDTRLLRSVSEKSFAAQVLEVAERYGWTRYHTHDARRSPRGFPDEVLVKPPRVIFAELKTEQGKTTRDQERWLSLFERCPGVEAYCWRPSQLEAVWAALAPEGDPYVAAMQRHPAG